MQNALAVTPGAPVLRSGKTSVVLLPGAGNDPPVSGLVRTDERGALVAVKTLVPLSEERGELWKFKGKFIPTALGFRKVNQFVGVVFINPETVPGPDGGMRANPYYHRTADGERLLWIRQRKLGFWTNAVGKPVLYDYTLTFDLTLYLAQDMYGKWTPKGYKDKPIVTKSWGRLLPDMEAVQATRKATEKAYAMPDGSYLVVDLTSPEVVGVIGEHISRQKFADRLCDTFCERNILKKAVAVGHVGSDGTGTVPVVSWQTSQDDVVRQLAEVGTGEALANAMRGREVSTGQDVISDPEDIESVVAGEISEHEAPPPFVDAPGSIAPSEPAAPANPELQPLRARIRELAATIGIEEGLEALGQAGIDGLGEVGVCGDVDLLKAGIVQLEKAQLAKVSRERVKAKGKSPAAKPKGAGKLPLEGDSRR